MHEHKECEHKDVKYCSKCRVVYCTKCGKEWYENNYWVYPYYPVYPNTQPYYPWITYTTNSEGEVKTTYGEGTSGLITCKHGT
jgi:hypothetical protein